MDVKSFNLSSYLNYKEQSGDNCGDHEAIFVEECGDMARALQEDGAILVLDPTYKEKNMNQRYLSTLELFFKNVGYEHQNFFENRDDILKKIGVEDIDKFQLPRVLSMEELSHMPKEYKPTVGINQHPVLTLFHHWNVGSGSTNVKSSSNFTSILDTMSSQMLKTAQVVAEMIAIGFGLPKTEFTSLIDMGSHTLTSSGCNLTSFGRKGIVLAPFHNVSNFITVKSRTRFPALNIWLNGRKVQIDIPAGYLLIQTGRQMEWLTGGKCKAGMKEAAVTDRTIDAINLAREQSRTLWKVASTLYVQIAPDTILKPLPCFEGSPLAGAYAPTRAGDLAGLL